MDLRMPFRIAALILPLMAVAAAGEDIRYNPVPREVVESRLGSFAGNDRRREQSLEAMFKDAGCDDQQLIQRPVKGSKLPNVICTLPGTTDKTIIVGAHFDHVAAGDGVADNWSGASLLPSLYQAVKGEPRRHTYVFIGFTDEERGMVGSRDYARQMTKEQVAATDAMVNLDTLGLAPTEYWASRADGVLANALTYIAGRLNVPLTGVNVEKIGTTDSEQFAARKIPSISVHSLTQQALDARILHSYKDRLRVIRLDDYYQTYRLLAAYLCFLDQVQRPAAPPKR